MDRPEFSTTRTLAKAAVAQFQNTDKVARLKRALIENAICFPSEADFVAKRCILEQDDTRIKAVEWLVARHLYQLLYSQQSDITQQPAALQAKMLHFAQLLMSTEKTAFEDITHPGVIQDALQERGDFEVAKQERQAEWRRK